MVFWVVYQLLYCLKCRSNGYTPRLYSRLTDTNSRIVAGIPCRIRMLSVIPGLAKVPLAVAVSCTPT